MAEKKHREPKFWGNSEDLKNYLLRKKKSLEELVKKLPRKM